MSKNKKGGGWLLPSGRQVYKVLSNNKDERIRTGKSRGDDIPRASVSGRVRRLSGFCLACPAGTARGSSPIGAASASGPDNLRGTCTRRPRKRGPCYQSAEERGKEPGAQGWIHLAAGGLGKASWARGHSSDTQWGRPGREARNRDTRDSLLNRPLWSACSHGPLSKQPALENTSGLHCLM